jgi:hypothetical protein
MSGADASGGGPVLSRGAFLATGAAAAAGATVGKLAAAPPVPARRLMEGSCAGPLPTREDWAIPAGILNTFWNDVFPRIVGAYWAAKAPDSALSAAQNAQNAALTMDDWDFQAFLDAVQDPPVSNPGRSFNLPSNMWSGSSPLFQNRLSAVSGYLASNAGVMPIHFLGEGEFDFILSDQGMDVFIPPNPTNERELLRYYTFRATGRRAIGLPLYLTTSGLASAMSTDSATGPSQVLMNLANVQAYLASSYGASPCVGEVITCLSAYAASPADINGRGGGRGGGGGPTLQDGDIALGLQEYMCALKALRHWQLSGSVYRAIMTELPRVVAEVWLEGLDVQACVPGQAVQLEAYPRDAYTRRFAGDGGGENGIRQIFRERLETSLPHYSEMRFRTYADTAPYDDELLPPPASGQGVNWQPGDVMITNRGMFFPTILPTAPSLRQFCQAISAGRGGNPVFTDSILCE